MCSIGCEGNCNNTCYNLGCGNSCTGYPGNCKDTCYHYSCSETCTTDSCAMLCFTNCRNYCDDRCSGGCSGVKKEKNNSSLNDCCYFILTRNHILFSQTYKPYKFCNRTNSKLVKQQQTISVKISTLLQNLN